MPTTLEGIGYWGGKFYIKDITLEEFLAQQMASRIRMRFREKKGLEKYTLKSVTGKFVGEYKPRHFFIGFNAESLLFILDPERRKTLEKEVFGNVFEEMSDVIYGYKFRNFELAEIVEKSSNTKLLISKNNMYLFKRKKLGIDAILGGL